VIKRMISSLMALALVALPVLAAGDKKETERPGKLRDDRQGSDGYSG